MNSRMNRTARVVVFIFHFLLQFIEIDNSIAPMQGFHTRPEEFKRSMKNQRVLSTIACLFLAVASTYSQAAAQQDRTTVQIQNLIEKLSTNDDKTRFEASLVIV